MLHIPGVLSPEQVAQCRTRLRETDWVDGRQSVGSQGAQVKRNRQLLEGSPLALELGGIVSAALMANPLFFSSVLPLRILPPYFNGYAGGEHYGPHVDGAIRAQRGGAAVRADVSCTVFLSEPDEYDGGELSTDGFGANGAVGRERVEVARDGFGANRAVRGKQIGGWSQLFLLYVPG